MKVEVDYLVVGKDYTSLVLTNLLQAQEKKVVFFENENFKLGELFSDRLGALEKKFLELCGDYSEVKELCQLELYLYKDPTHLNLDGAWVFLSDCPAKNLRELIRKFPNWFSSENENLLELLLDSKQRDKIRDEFNDYISFFARILHGHDYVNSIDFKYVFSYFPEYLKRNFLSFKSFFNKEDQSLNEIRKKKKILSALQCLFKNSMSDEVSDFEYFYLFLNLISPRYSIDGEKLRADLTKSTNEKVIDWKLDNSIMWESIKKKELASLDSLFELKFNEKLIVLGDATSEGDLSKIRTFSNEDRKRYTKVQMSLSIEEAGGLGLWEGKKSYIAHQVSHFPLVQIQFKQKEVHLEFLVEKSKSFKLRSYKELVHKSALAILEAEYGLKLKFKIKNFLLKDEFVCEKMNRERNPHSVKKTKEVVYLEKIGKKKKLKNVEYYGVFSEYPLGLLSVLMRINRVGRAN